MNNNELLKTLREEREARQLERKPSSIKRHIDAEEVGHNQVLKQVKRPKTATATNDGKMTSNSSTETIDLTTTSVEDASEALARQLQQKELQQDGNDAASLALARRLQQEESSASSSFSSSSSSSTSPSSSSSSSSSFLQSHSSSGMPWQKEVTWQEMQHPTGPKKCGNFNVCDKGSTFFYCREMDETTAHGLVPVPLLGQTIHIKRIKTIRKNGLMVPNMKKYGTDGTPPSLNNFTIKSNTSAVGVIGAKK